MVHPKARGKPTIVALEHLSNTKPEEQERLFEAKIQVRHFLESLAKDGKKRTVYLEVSPESMQQITSKNMLFKATDPFMGVIDFAKRNGWKIVCLDNPKIDLKTYQAVERLGDIFGRIPIEVINSRYCQDALEARFNLMNLRAQVWAHLTRTAQPEDLIIMHPNHVNDFLLESGILGKNVKWISKPRPKQEKIRRLGSKERRILKRLQQRKLR